MPRGPSPSQVRPGSGIGAPAVPSSSTTRELAPAEQRNVRPSRKQTKPSFLARNGGPCFAFSFFALGVVPVLVFLIAAVMAVPIWRLECGEVDDFHEYEPGLDPCSFYGWWKYIMGNLVGLATPLTSLSPIEGHVTTEVVDLLVAVWSLALSGLAIGIMANLIFVTNLVETGDTKARLVMTQFLLWIAGTCKTSHGETMDIHEFTDVVSSSGLNIPATHVTELFNEEDKDGSGVIDHKEAQKLLKRLCDIVEAGESDVSSSEFPQLSDANGISTAPSLDKVLTVLTELQAGQKKLQMDVDDIRSKLGATPSRPFGSDAAATLPRVARLTPLKEADSPGAKSS